MANTCIRIGGSTSKSIGSKRSRSTSRGFSCKLENTQAFQSDEIFAD